MWQDAVPDRPDGRARVGWWLFIAALAAVAAFIAYSFVGMIALGVFGYYATRPIYHRIEEFVESDSVAAGLTVLLVVVPVILLALYAGFAIFQQVSSLLSQSGATIPPLQNYPGVGGLTSAQQQRLAEILQRPTQLVSQPRQVLQTLFRIGTRVFSAVFGALVLIALALTLSYFLLEHEESLSDGLVELFGGRETTAYAYASVVDEDLESVFFGNLLFVLAMSVIAAVAYSATNYVAPAGVRVPMVLVLALLTGVASLIPIVVGKVVYIPVVAYLAVQTLQTGGINLLFLAGTLVAYFLMLDLLPQTFLQPYITGRDLDMVLLMFAYLLGPILFGWYGFFLLPILFILMLEAIRIVLPELLHGRALTPDVSMGESVGADPPSVRPDPAAEETSDDSDGATDTD